MGYIADSIIDGEFCQLCGQYIGPPCGYPRDCGCGNSPSMIGHVTANKAHKREVETEKLMVAVKELGLSVEMFNTASYRVTKDNITVDYFPTHRKYFIHGSQKRGKLSYDKGVKDFLIEQFNNLISK